MMSGRYDGGGHKEALETWLYGWRSTGSGASGGTSSAPQRLWGLRFSDGTGAQASAPTNTLFFTAGVNDEADGLFGTITPADNATPENDRDDH